MKINVIGGKRTFEITLDESEAELLLFITRLNVTIPKDAVEAGFNGGKYEIKEFLDSLRTNLDTYNLNKRGW